MGYWWLFSVNNVETIDDCRYNIYVLKTFSISKPFQTCIESTTNKAPSTCSFHCSIDYSCYALTTCCVRVSQPLHAGHDNKIICQMVDRRKGIYAIFSG